MIKNQKKKQFQSSSKKISILDQDKSIYLFHSPKKSQESENLLSPKREKVRKTIAEKMREYGY